MMKTYEIRFTGRKVGAIGKSERFTVQVFADDIDVATIQLYDRYEHVSRPEIKEIQSPFDFNGLVERVQNTQEEHARIRTLTTLLRCEMQRIAARQTQANCDWHDDPDAPDYALYHSPVWLQFPREAQDAAILELVSRHLEVMNENETTDANGKAVVS